MRSDQWKIKMLRTGHVRRETAEQTVTEVLINILEWMSLVDERLKKLENKNNDPRDYKAFGDDEC